MLCERDIDSPSSTPGAPSSGKWPGSAVLKELSDSFSKVESTVVCETQRYNLGGCFDNISGGMKKHFLSLATMLEHIKQKKFDRFNHIK